MGQESLQALNLTSSLLDPNQLGVSSSKQLRLVIYAHESTSASAAARAADLHTVSNQLNGSLANENS